MLIFKFVILFSGSARIILYDLKCKKKHSHTVLAFFNLSLKLSV